MMTREEIVQTVRSLGDAELEQLAQYLAFIRFQSRINPAPKLMKASWLNCIANSEQRTANSQKKECQITSKPWRERTSDDSQPGRSVAG